MIYIYEYFESTYTHHTYVCTYHILDLKHSLKYSYICTVHGVHTGLEYFDCNSKYVVRAVVRFSDASLFDDNNQKSIPPAIGHPGLPPSYHFSIAFFRFRSLYRKVFHINEVLTSLVFHSSVCGSFFLLHSDRIGAAATISPPRDERRNKTTGRLQTGPFLETVFVEDGYCRCVGDYYM